MSESRLYNLSAGPAVLPEEVVQKVQANLFNYDKSGVGIMEISHRSAAFDEIISKAKQDLRSLLSIGEDYQILFSTGGATAQFSAVPMNLLRKGTTADFINTGVWSEKAIKEAQKFGEVAVKASSEDDSFNYIPKDIRTSKNSAYLHFTSNNTIYGTQFHKEPEAGGTPLICDASSDFLHKKININKYDLIYAGAQKNIGPSGVSIIILKKKLLSGIPEGLPVLIDYRTLSKTNSMYNTPPTFPIYVVSEVLEWIVKGGGLETMHEKNKEKASLLYDVIDNSSMYLSKVKNEDRSLMNVTFRLATDELEKSFLDASLKKGFVGLKGHRKTGGIRASIYNAFPKKGVSALISFMKEFESSN